MRIQEAFDEGIVAMCMCMCVLTQLPARTGSDRIAELAVGPATPHNFGN